MKKKITGGVLSAGAIVLGLAAAGCGGAIENAANGWEMLGYTLLEPGWAREKDVDGILLLVNEEGRLKGLPENPRAEEMVSYAAPAHAKLVGPAIVAAGRGEEIIGFAKPVAETICAEWL